MKYAYPAVFTSEKENVLVSVPDLKGLHTYGGSMTDAAYMARDAVEMWLCDAENNGEPIPSASSPSDIAATYADRNQTVSMIAADTDEYRRQNDEDTMKREYDFSNAWPNPYAKILQRSGSRVAVG